MTVCKRCECKGEHSSLCLRSEHQEGHTEEGLLGPEARGEVWQPDQREAVTAETEVRLGSVGSRGNRVVRRDIWSIHEGGSMVGLEGAGCPAGEPKLDSVSMGPCQSFLTTHESWVVLRAGVT